MTAWSQAVRLDDDAFAAQSGHAATLTLEWRSFSPPREETRAYTFEFATFDARAEKQENPPL